MVSQNTLFTVIPFHNLSDCDLYTPPPRGVTGRQKQPGQNEEIVPKRGTTSVARTRVLKLCSLIQTDFKMLKHKQQSYMRAPSLSVWEKREKLCVREAQLYASESPSLQVSSQTRVKNIKDTSHPGYHPFNLLPSVRRYRSLRAKTTRLQNSFFPVAIRTLNS